MAKISARGAAKICSVRAVSAAEYEYILTMCSDGRVLVKPSDGTEGYRVYMKDIDPRYRNMDGLRRLCKIKKMTINAEQQSPNSRMIRLEAPVFGNDFCTIGPEIFAKDTEKGNLFYLSVQRNIGHSIAITCLTRQHLKAIREVIDGFLEEG